MKSLYLIILILLCTNSYSQSGLENFLDLVEENNREINSAAKLAEAEQLNARTGLWPENPGIEYGYFPAKEAGIGVKQVWSVKQSFDFPTSYITKSRISEVSHIRNEYIFAETKQRILTEAALTYYHWVYLQKKQEEYERRLNNARQLYESYQIRFEKGDISVLDYNKAKFQYLDILNDTRSVEQDLKSTEEELRLFAGGTEPEWDVNDYHEVALLHPDSIIQKSTENDPLLNALREEMIISGLAVKLSRREYLPDFNVGYETEAVPDATFRGFRAGISIPLWEKKNTIKLAKAERAGTESRYDENLERLKIEKERLYNEALNLKTILEEYESLLSSTSNIGYLQKALDLGQISVIEYFTELTMYYSVIDKSLESERDFYQVVIELYDYRL